MNVRVGQSKIHGKGCFATRAFASGELIGIFEGRVLNTQPKGERARAYVWWTMDRDGRFFGILGDGVLRFMNHAEKPNAVISEGGPFVYATYPIRRGEELTIDYGENWETAT